MLKSLNEWTKQVIEYAKEEPATFALSILAAVIVVAVADSIFEDCLPKNQS
jgi:hypothetical protein